MRSGGWKAIKLREVGELRTLSGTGTPKVPGEEGRGVLEWRIEKL